MVASLSESVASNFVAVPNRKRKQFENSAMSTSTSGRRVFVDGLRWTRNLENLFIDLMYDEVIRGNLLGSTFTPCVWSDIQNNMKSKCGQDFTIKQLREKLSRIKLNWRKYKNLMLFDTGLSWDHERDVPLADDNWWQIYLQARPEDSNLRNKSCRGYLKLCTLFDRNTATGSRARSSTQRPPDNIYSGPTNVNEAINLDTEEDPARAGNTQVRVGFETEGCSSRARKGKKQVLDRLINSFENASKSISSNLNDEKIEDECNAIVNALRTLPDVSVELMVKALIYLDKPDRRYLFLALYPTEQRAFIDQI